MRNSVSFFILKKVPLEYSLALLMGLLAAQFTPSNFSMDYPQACLMTGPFWTSAISSPLVISQEEVEEAFLNMHSTRVLIAKGSLVKVMANVLLLWRLRSMSSYSSQQNLAPHTHDLSTRTKGFAYIAGQYFRICSFSSYPVGNSYKL